MLKLLPLRGGKNHFKPRPQNRILVSFKPGFHMMVRIVPVVSKKYSDNRDNPDRLNIFWDDWDVVNWPVIKKPWSPFAHTLLQCTFCHLLQMQCHTALDMYIYTAYKTLWTSISLQWEAFLVITLRMNSTNTLIWISALVDKANGKNVRGKILYHFAIWFIDFVKVNQFSVCM